MKIKPRYVALLLALAVLFGAAGAYIGIEYFADGTNKQTQSEQYADKDAENFGNLSEEEQKAFLESMSGNTDLKKVEQAYNTIKENYVEEVDKKSLVEGAIQGMLDTLEDPYSVYMDPETMEQFNQSIESSFQGIGAEVSMVNDKVTIVAPIKGSPAEEAGLKPNDQILKVDGDSVEGLDLYEAVLKIRGEKGTEVTLQVDRPGISEPLNINITRDDIPLETVYTDTKEVDGKKAGIIEITSFSEKTSDEFHKALEKLENDGMDGLVIDVRGNPGGLFTDVQEILKEFIPKDKPIVQVEDRKGEKTRYFSENKEKKPYPITVLMDEGSASASEILAATMQEAGGYELVGTKSFGKGTVQQALPMGDGSTIKLTLFKWLTPDGNWIHEKGVKPTVEVKQPEYFYTNPVEVEESLQYNDNHEKVKNIQIMLKGLGHDPGRTDGYFSKETEEAVKAFQSDVGLETTGIVDEKTGGKLEEAIISEVRDEKNDKQMQKAVEVLFQ
ncbi:S41 family peptidase [Halobacillus karajensis]|uniref:C-terminal processing peptidase n=1 Tax=Halobacillus karajensis TaxID=195088 RepID=A0A059NWG5_9BACI|nr:S41 family peptidase [Halobacillus karajensis]CDQ19226.1 Carboxy-terminal processing protease CtpB precursor [Halobacillus karajensis]CDQ22700.1 Carboxy-terminal processing protease CtpB precursor [Halobacillus karajensis]CDQ26182.1 Carboxy-terminal processing protease CtpB precursor [Halobacillus karajensis]